MSNLPHNPLSLDIRSFTQQAIELEGLLLLSKCERLVQDLYGHTADLASKTLAWRARGESVVVTGGAAQSWLHLWVEGALPLQCQRCLHELDHPVQVQRSFRFVRDENEAVAQDLDSEEDVLVTSQQFDLLAFIEDEVLMALPFAPLHEKCPEPVKLEAKDEGFELAMAAKPHAFAALGVLKHAKSSAK